MLSILIPVFNYDPSPLIHTLFKELEHSNGEVEVLLGNDKSDKSFHQVFIHLQDEHPLLRVINQEHNLGYNDNRNRLVDVAKGNYLLFLDSDVVPKNKGFIQSYLHEVDKNPNAIICGGFEYGEKPLKPELLLKWMHGSKKEQKNTAERKAEPGLGFHAGNFCLPKSILLARPFIQGRNQYGYNDTFLGLLFEQMGFSIIHINNPVEHLGLYPAEKVLKRVPESIDNLEYLSKKSGLNREYLMKIKLYATIEKIRHNSLLHSILNSIKFLRKPLRKKLLSSNPSLKAYDLYRVIKVLDYLDLEKKS